jgi:hypothetical protein
MIIEVTAKELASRNLTPRDFQALPPQRRRWEVTQILYARGDERYKMLQLAIPQANRFQIVMGG